MSYYKITYSYKQDWKKEIVIKASDYVQAKAKLKQMLNMNSRDEFKYYADREIEGKKIYE